MAVAHITVSLLRGVLLVALPGALAAQADSIVGSRTPTAHREPRIAASALTPTAPVIDGKLDDEVWKKARAIAGFVQREPREGAAISERTEVRILTDREALYVAAWLYDREPQGIVRGERVRDGTLTNSDYFGFILDTYLDRQNGFVFATTPAGIEYDGQVVKEGEGGGVFQQGQTRQQAGSMGGFNLNWDGSWKVATSVDSLGWYAEFRIPFSTLRYGGGAVQNWGLNLVRSIRRRNEEAFWSFIPRQFSLMRLSRAGTLQGIPVPTRRIATITPYVLGSVRRDSLSGFTTDYPKEAGIDVKLGLSPSLTLDLTYNTDFAQVEVDQQQTNLTRFPLFFPEKRPFFLENAGVFSAGTPQAVDLFFSRKIGITDSGQQVPILGGGRITGKAGGVTLGLLQIFTQPVPGAVPEEPANSYSVARVNRELPGRSRIGALFVQRIATDSGADHNRTYAVDGRVGLGEAWTVDWWGAKTETPGLHGRDAAFSARLGLENRVWSNSLRFVQVGENFNPEVGFLSRSGYRFFEAQALRKVRLSDNGLVRTWIPHMNYRSYWDFKGFQETGYLHLDPEMEFSSGGRFGPEFNFSREGLTEPFEIADGVFIPPGVYDWFSNGWDFSTNPSSPFSTVLRLDLGGFYNGTRYGGTLTLTYRRGAAITTSLIVDFQDVNLPVGDFDRSLVGLRLGYLFTPRIFVQSLIQYSNQARIWSANARFGWLNTAGTGLFVVFNEAQEADGLARWLRSQHRSFTVKFTKQFGTGG